MAPIPVSSNPSSGIQYGIAQSSVKSANLALLNHLHSWMSQRKAVDSEVFYPSIPGDLVTSKSPAFTSDSSSDPSALLTVNHRIWRSAAPMSRVGVDLGRVYNLSAVLIFWWDRCWAENFQVESSLSGTEWSVVADHSQFVSVYDVNRVSLCSLSDKRCRYLRVSMKDGHLDAHFRRYMFGIGKISVLGEVYRSQSEIFSSKNVSMEIPEEESFEDRMNKTKAKSSIKWLALCQTSDHPWREAQAFTASSWTMNKHRTPYLLRPQNIFQQTDNHFLSRSSRRNYHSHSVDRVEVCGISDPRSRFWPPPEVPDDSLARVVAVASRVASALPLVSRTDSAGLESVSKSSRESRQYVRNPSQ
jgi:hypothetical protein